MQPRTASDTMLKVLRTIAVLILYCVMVAVSVPWNIQLFAKLHAQGCSATF